MGDSGTATEHVIFCWGWSGGAMVLGKLPVPGRPTSLDKSRTRAVVWTFLLSSILSLFFLPLFGR